MVTAKSDQREAPKCYFRSTKKVKPRNVNVVIVDMDMMDVPGKKGHEQENVEMVNVLDEVFILDETISLRLNPSPRQLQ